MGKLPFVVAPRANSRIETLGSDESGKIEIERKGYLSVGEKSFMANANAQDDILQLVMKLSRKVATKFKLGQQEAYEQVVLAVSEPDKCSYPVVETYGKDITGLATTMMAAEQKKKVMMAYCLLVFRVNEEIELEEVLDLHEDLVEALVALYLDEESKSVERLVNRDEERPEGSDGEIEEIEKK